MTPVAADRVLRGQPRLLPERAKWLQAQRSRLVLQKDSGINVPAYLLDTFTGALHDAEEELRAFGFFLTPLGDIVTIPTCKPRATWRSPNA